MTPVRPNGDVRLFLLDEEGVLFSESRQELYSLNSAGTALWCLLDDCNTVPALVDGYARTFGLDHEEAERHVLPTLRRWFALGHISDPGLTAPSDIPLTEALAFLLTNAPLRDAFRESPVGVGAALGITADELDMFLALDPDALDRQARLIVEGRKPQRASAHTAGGALDATEMLAAAACDWVSDSTSRYYRFVETTFRVTMPPVVDAFVCPVLAHLETSDRRVDVDLHVRTSGHGCVVFDGLAPIVWCPTHATRAGAETRAAQDRGRAS